MYLYHTALMKVFYFMLVIKYFNILKNCQYVISPYDVNKTSNPLLTAKSFKNSVKDKNIIDDT